MLRYMYAVFFPEIFIGRFLSNSFCSWPSSGILTSANFSECISACLLDVSCSAFNYREENEECALASSTAGAVNPVTATDKTAWKFYGY